MSRLDRQRGLANALYVIEGGGNDARADLAAIAGGARGRGTNGRVDRRFELMAA
jgi:hypothetical protein